jgi:uridylate kinase
MVETYINTNNSGILMQKTYVLSVGGSLIVPEEVDVKFLSDFKELITAYTKKGNKFLIYCGGGMLARQYQNKVKAKKDDLDWIGIYASRLNAELVRGMFGELAEEKVLYDPTKKLRFTKPILVAAGWKPGWSTDYDAVLAAKNLKIDTVINLSNVDYVYNKDPRKFKGAKPIKKITWKAFKQLVGGTWKPGLNMPFDPIAAKEAEKSHISVVVMKSLTNLKKLLDGKKFDGTIIS